MINVLERNEEMCIDRDNDMKPMAPAIYTMQWRTE